MATVRPFRGMRFDTRRVGNDLSSVVCPAAEAIPPARRKTLHDRHPYNFCRLIAPLSEVELSPRAQGGAWLSEGILIRDPSVSYYLVRQTFTATVGGVDDRFIRLGLVADLEYDPLSDTSVLTPFAELQTSMGSLSDTEGTRFLLEPALIGYADPHQTLGPLLAHTLSQPPLARVLDDESVEHTLHAIVDETTVEAIQAFFRSRSLLVLDGGGWSSASRRLGVLVETSDPGLFSSPVHRVYRGPRNVAPSRLESLLAQEFKVEHLPWAGGDAASALLAASAEGHHAFVLRWKDAEELLLIQAPHGSFPQVSGAAGGSIPLDSVVLDQIVEDRVRSLTPETSTLSVRDAHDTMEVLDRLEDGRFAVLSNPCPISSLETVASRGGQIPAQSVLFLPRLCCGLVSLPLHG